MLFLPHLPNPLPSSPLLRGTHIKCSQHVLSIVGFTKFFLNLLLFQKTRATETGISNYHKLISTFFKSRYTRLTPEIIYYRNFKNSNEKLLVKDLGNSNIAVNSEDPPREFCPIHFLKPYKSIPQ